MGQLWAANTIPVPAAVSRTEGRAEAAPAADLFSKGEVVKFFPQQSYGFVRDHIGRELFFHVDEIDLLGPKNKKDFIHVGAKIGYDCCRTPHGLRVKRMKIY